MQEQSTDRPFERAMRIGEVARILHVDCKTVQRQIPESFRTEGGHRRYYESDVRAALQAAQVRPSGGAR